MSKRPLSSDELGRLGERKFPDLCDPRLQCNKSNEDRMGWDYLVEWGNHAQNAVPLDTRVVPLSCHVQVKSAWVDNDTVAVRLTALERLAKEPKPAFIYIMKFNNNTKHVLSHIVHIRGAFLQFVLKELRLAHVNKKAANKHYVRFSVKQWASELEIDPTAFRLYVENIVGQSMANYMQEKDNELKNLGYELGRIQISGQLIFKNRNDMQLAFAGERDVTLNIQAVNDIRFSIPVPVAVIPLGPSIGRISPSNATKCELKIWPNRQMAPIIIDGTITPIPDFACEAGYMEAIVKTNLCRIKLKFKKPKGDPVDGSMTLIINAADFNVSLKPQEWCDFYQFMDLASRNAVWIEIWKRDGLLLPGTIRINTAPKDQGNWQRVAALTATLNNAFRVAGTPNTKINIVEALKYTSEIDLLQTIQDNPTSINFNMKTSLVPGMEYPHELEVLYFGTIPCGSNAIFYCAKLKCQPEIEGASAIWKNTSIELEGITRIISPVADILDDEASQYLQRMQIETGVESYYIGQLSKAN